MSDMKKGFDYYAVMNEIDSNSHLYITKEPSMDFDIRRSFELLGDIGSQDWTDEDSDGLFKMVCHYISRYVYRLYGMSYINRWMREHQGSSFIDLFTASDVAYTNMVIYGNSRVWEQAIEIRNMDVEEQEKYKPKNRMKLPYDQQEKYKKKKGRFFKTCHKGEYCEDKITKEGKLYYRDQLVQWKELLRSANWVDRLRLTWELHAKEKNFGHHWQISERNNMDAEDGGMDNSDDDEEDDFMNFALPGMKGFEEDRPWKQRSRMSREPVRQGNDGRGGGDDDESDDDEVSLEDKQYRHNEIDGSMRRSSRKRMRYGDDDDDDNDDDDEDNMRTPTKGIVGNKNRTVTAEKQGRK